MLVHRGGARLDDVHILLAHQLVDLHKGLRIGEPIHCEGAQRQSQPASHGLSQGTVRPPRKDAQIVLVRIMAPHGLEAQQARLDLVHEGGFRPVIHGLTVNLGQQAAPVREAFQGLVSLSEGTTEHAQSMLYGRHLAIVLAHVVLEFERPTRADLVYTAPVTPGSTAGPARLQNTVTDIHALPLSAPGATFSRVYDLHDHYSALLPLLPRPLAGEWLGPVRHKVGRPAPGDISFSGACLTRTGVPKSAPLESEASPCTSALRWRPHSAAFGRTPRQFRATSLATVPITGSRRM